MSWGSFEFWFCWWTCCNGIVWEIQVIDFRREAISFSFGLVVSFTFDPFALLGRSDGVVTVGMRMWLLLYDNSVLLAASGCTLEYRLSISEANTSFNTESWFALQVLDFSGTRKSFQFKRTGRFALCCKNKLHNTRWFDGANHHFYFYACRSTNDLAGLDSRREQLNFKLKEIEWFFR